MLCPNCNHNLTPLAVEEIELDKCHGCGSIWFDAGELENYMSKRQIATEKLSSKFVPYDRQFDEKCPRCLDAKMSFGHMGGQPMSYCLDCDGVLLTKDQLKELKPSNWDTVLNVLYEFINPANYLG